MFEQGYNLYNNQKYNESIECYEKAIEINPNYIDAWEGKGKSLSYLGKHNAAEWCYTKAIKCCDNVLKKDKMNEKDKMNAVKALSDKAEFLNVFGKYNEAVECCENAIDINPNDKEAWSNKGEALSFLERYEEAIKCYEKAIKLSPHDAEAHNGKGKNLHLLGKYSEAMDCFQTAISIDNKYVYAHNNKGKSLLNKSEFLVKSDNYKAGIECLDEAIECFKEATDLLDKYEEAKYNRSICYLKKGVLKYEKEEDYKEALGIFKKIDDWSLEGEKSNNIGLCYLQLGSNDDAERQFIKAINSKSKSAAPYYNLGVLYNNTNRPDAAKRLFDTCLKIDRDFTHAYIALKNIEGSHQLDWYAWWFGTPKGKRVKNANAKKHSGQASFKRVLGIGLIAIILFLIVLIVYSDVGGKSLNSNDVAGLTIMTGFLVALLLLPSLTKFKVATLEMDTISPVQKSIELEPKLSDVPLEQTRKFISRH